MAPTSFECPRCGKSALVKRSTDVYQCVNCNYKRDLSQTSASGTGTDIFWALISIIFVTFLISRSPTNSPRENTSPQSQAVPSPIIK